MPISVRRDIDANYKDEGTRISFRNILYRMVALRRDQHLNTAKNDRRVAMIIALHSFLQQQCKEYREKCTLIRLPRAPFPEDPDFTDLVADDGRMKVPSSLVSGQWYCETNNEDMVELLYLLGRPKDGSDAPTKQRNSKSSSDDVEQDTLVLKKLSVSYRKIYGLQQRVRAIRIGLDVTDRSDSEKRFDECVVELQELLSAQLEPVSKTKPNQAGARPDSAEPSGVESRVSNDEADKQAELSSQQLNLPSDSEECHSLLKDLDDLLNVSTGLDAQSPALCKWIWSLVVGEDAAA